ncbi:uncharacterized protein LOC119407072 isoform X1 [Rhipicephalus sanguineus]|uniref:uncharacterized protein LOC119407072 isoform X1 n=1 Tax=Rhipicephalus sanguineus TaxID=34632 RepID=UPI001893903E|nr:uncharacterized protein LOC119407072 isoform X1 [Rhipicephalus sanguineus]
MSALKFSVVLTLMLIVTVNCRSTGKAVSRPLNPLWKGTGQTGTMGRLPSFMKPQGPVRRGQIPQTSKTRRPVKGQRNRDISILDTDPIDPDCVNRPCSGPGDPRCHPECTCQSFGNEYRCYNA